MITNLHPKKGPQSKRLRSFSVRNIPSGKIILVETIMNGKQSLQFSFDKLVDKLAIGLALELTHDSAHCFTEVLHASSVN